jgi:hypothetical protein
MVMASHKIFGLSISLAMALTTVAVFKVGNPWKGTINLYDMAKHNGVEHDASLVHDNASKGEEYAPIKPGQELLKEFIASSSDGSTISQEDFMRWRVKRESVSPPLPSNFHTSALMEVGVMVEVFGGEEKKVPIHIIEQLFGEERIPDFSILHSLGIFGSISRVKRLQSIWDSLAKH